MKVRVKSHFFVTQDSIDAGIQLVEGSYDVGTVLDVVPDLGEYLVDNGFAVPVDGKEA